MIDRVYVEAQGRRGAGIIDSVGDYHWVKVLNEFEMYVHKDDKSVSPHLINEGFWESWITAWVKNNVNAGKVFFDIGANTGYYSFAAMAAGAIVHAFEPNPVYAKMLEATKDRNQLGGLFRISEYALSDWNGEAILHIPTELHGSASLSEIVPGYETTEVSVAVRSLDEVARPGAGKHLVKIDAEGEEEKILRGMRQFINDAIPSPTIMMEYTPGAYSRYFLADLFHEWDVTWINHGGYEGSVSPEGLMNQTDWIMLVLRKKTKSGTMAQRG